MKKEERIKERQERKWYKKRKFLIVVAVILFLVLIDQVMKIVGTNYNGKIIPGILNFTTVHNTGGAFGVGQNSTFTFIITNIIVLGIIIKFMLMQEQQIDKKTYFSLCLILAGGIGNVIDRLFRGYVVDFIDVSPMFSFPKFNIADIYIVLGWILLAAFFATFTYHTSKMKKQKGEKIE